MFQLPIDLMDHTEREDYLDARFEAARDAEVPWDGYEGLPEETLPLPFVWYGKGWVSECCDALYQGIESPWCLRCHNNTGYYRAYCPGCGDTLEHFGGLDAIPEGLACADCNDAIYDMVTGEVIARLT